MVLTFVTNGLEYFHYPHINCESEEPIIFAHGECPVRGIGSVVGAELRPKCFWGERNKRQRGPSKNAVAQFIGRAERR